jgi:hypothetical protein
MVCIQPEVGGVESEGVTSRQVLPIMVISEDLNDLTYEFFLFGIELKTDLGSANPLDAGIQCLAF